MVPAVDCAIIHSCNWDLHVDRARPFVEAGKAVLIDKPMAGNLRDLNQIKEWAQGGVRIAGGSSLRFCDEIIDWVSQPVEERGTPHTVLCGCAVDEFNYGIHAYSMLSGILGPGVESVRHLAGNVQHKIQVNWQDGRHIGLLVVGEAEGWMPFYATIITEKRVSQLEADAGKLYRALLTVTLPYLAGETDRPPASIEDLIEPKLCALAARKSWLEGNREVRLDELTEKDGGYDGAKFGVAYRKARYA
jgi:hypothetical protein